MSLKTKREALTSIKTRVHIVHGVRYTLYDAYLGINEVSKKVERMYDRSKGSLEERIENFYRARELAGDFSNCLTADEIFDAKAAIKSLRSAGIDISLTECARREVERHKAVSAGSMAKAGDAYDEFLKTKREGEDKRKTVATTGKWVEMAGRDTVLTTVRTADVKSYLDSKYGEMSPKTYNSHLSYINTFLNWCAKHDPAYLVENPAKPIKYREIEWKEPEYMDPETVEKLFRALETDKAANDEILALAISGFFCGVRRAESIRIGETDDAARIHLDDETIRIGKGKGFTRGRRPRAAQIEPNALAWMKSFDYLAAIKKVDDGSTQRLWRFAEAHGIKMFHNVARHTFITMHVAAYGDPAKTQAMVGTSGTMMCNNYRGLASRKEGEAYFAIYPSSLPESGS